MIRPLFFGAWAAHLALIGWAFFFLPEHFIHDGRASERWSVALTAAVLGLVVPWLCAYGIRLMARHGGAGLNIPWKSYWVQPDRVDELQRRLRISGLWLGLFMLATLSASFYGVVQLPLGWPRVEPTVWIVFVSLWVVALVVWIVDLHRRLRPPAPTPASDDPATRRPRVPVHRPRA